MARTKWQYKNYNAKIMLCDYSDAHTQVKQAITVIGYGYDDAANK